MHPQINGLFNDVNCSDDEATIGKKINE